MTFPSWVNYILILIMGIAGISPMAGQQLKLPRVFVVESYSSDYAWDAGWTKGLKSVLGSQAEISTFEMNTKKLLPEKHGLQADKAYQEFCRMKPDLVVLGDDAALQLVGPRLVDSGVPVVYLGINNNPRRYFSEMPAQFTGILERPLLKRSLFYFKDLLPKASRVLILFDSGITAEATKEELFDGQSEMQMGDTKVEIRIIHSLEDWHAEVLGAGKRFDFIILGLYQTIRDEKGNYVDPDTLGKWTSRNSPLPLFGFWDFSVSKDLAIGGFVLKSEDMGLMAGRMVMDILNGKDIRTLYPQTANQGQLIFSKAQLARWKLSIPEKLAAEVVYCE